MTDMTPEQIIDRHNRERQDAGFKGTGIGAVQALTAAGKVIFDREEAANSLYEAIKHGDAVHRAWLREACDNFFAGKPVPPPRAMTTDTGS